MLPAAAVGNGLAAPHAGGAVEVEVLAGARAGAMLQNKMPVEQDGLDLGQHAVVAVEVRPAGLHHADFGLGEVVDDLHDPVGRRHKVRIEDGDELALGYFQAGIERPGLEAMTVRAMNVNDGMAEGGVAVDDGGGDCRGLIGGVVEDLDFELVRRVLHGADGLNEAVNDELLVEDRQLDRDARQLREMPRRVGVVVLLVLEVLITHRVAVHAVEGKQNHHREIRQQHAGVEEIPVVKALEGLVGVLHFEVVAQAVLRGEGEECRDLPDQPPERAGGSKLESGERGDQNREPPQKDKLHCTRTARTLVMAGSRRFLIAFGAAEAKTAAMALKYLHPGR